MAKSVRQDPEPVPTDVNAWFFKETELNELLAGANPLSSIEDLAIKGLTREGAESFLRGVKE